VARSENQLRLVSNSDERLRSIIATLEESRTELVESANPEAAQILAMATLQLRMRLHRVADSDLRSLCDSVLSREAERAKKSDSPASKGRGWPNSIK
jgi:signal transduction histidine kinase